MLDLKHQAFKIREIHCRSTGIHSLKVDPFPQLADMNTDALPLRRLDNRQNAQVPGDGTQTN